MISDRNLMEDCGIAEEQQHTWIATITDMIDDGPKLILRLPNIRSVIISHTEPQMWYSKKATEFELLNLMYRNRCVQCKHENGVDSDPMIQAMLRRMDEILREVCQRMNCEGSHVHDLLEIYKMMLM